MPRQFLNISRMLLGALTLLSATYCLGQIQAAGSPGGTLATKLIGDRILTKVLLQTDLWSKETHIIIDYTAPLYLQMPQSLLQSIQFGENEDTLKILGADFRLEIVRDELAVDSTGDPPRITERFDNELEQVDVAAVLGWPALADFGVRLDTSAGSIELYPTAERTVTDAYESFTHVYDGVESNEDGAFLPILVGGTETSYLRFATDSYHTYLNTAEIRPDYTAQVPPDSLQFGQTDGLEFTQMAALYPIDLTSERVAQFEQSKLLESQFRESFPDVEDIPRAYSALAPAELGAPLQVKSGLTLVTGYRWEINPRAGFYAVSQTLDSNFSETDKLFYIAATATDRAELRKFVGAHPESRHVEEAVDQFLERTLAERGPGEEIAEMLEYGIAVNPERRQFRYLFNSLNRVYNDPELQEPYSEFIIALGERAMDFIANSQIPRFRQFTQLMLGDRYLAKGDADTAWRYFLSAAFNGDPRADGVVRHELGRAYEAQKRTRRAYASFLRALRAQEPIPPNYASSAREALDRLRPLLAEDDPLHDEVIPSG